MSSIPWNKHMELIISYKEHSNVFDTINYTNFYQKTKSVGKLWIGSGVLWTRYDGVTNTKG